MIGSQTLNIASVILAFPTMSGIPDHHPWRGLRNCTRMPEPVPQLPFGPYHPPALKVGDRAVYLFRDCLCVVTKLERRANRESATAHSLAALPSLGHARRFRSAGR
jgi:hypothetical protein